MKITRINKRPEIQKSLTKPKTTLRKIKRLVKESELETYVPILNELNKPGVFSYSDENRNKNAINLIKTHVNQAIMNYGNDLQYFRKYNTFFKDEDENNSNIIYGEDTTAEYYASGMIRAFVSVENMSWNFNNIGLESVEQVNITLSIENFEQVFSSQIAQTETKYFEVPVSGNTVNNELTGKIITPEFEANIYATFEDNLIVKNVNPKIVDKKINQVFYASNSYQHNESKISGTLSGKLKHDNEYPFVVYGMLCGDLTYRNLKNIEGSETWNLAPQVGDYFKMTTTTGIDEEWEISQVYNKILTSKGGINPLLGKYIFQCSAVKRQASYEMNKHDNELREPGEDLEEIFGNQSLASDAGYSENFQTTTTGKNKKNKKTEKHAKGIYDYENKSDQTYGGYQNEF
jgi:hypothetical protein